MRTENNENREGKKYTAIGIQYMANFARYEKEQLQQDEKTGTKKKRMVDTTNQSLDCLQKEASRQRNTFTVRLLIVQKVIHLDAFTSHNATTSVKGFCSSRTKQMN